MTNLDEEFRRASQADLAQALQAEEPPRGEVVLLVAPPSAKTVDYSDDEIDRLLREALTRGGTRDAAQEVASITGRPRRAL